MEKRIEVMNAIEQQRDTKERQKSDLRPRPLIDLIQEAEKERFEIIAKRLKDKPSGDTDKPDEPDRGERER